MNELTTDLKSLHEATLNNLKSSKANNTLRAYKSDFKDFGAFCAKHGLNSLPSEPKIVSIYLTHLSKNSKIFSAICPVERLYNNSVNANIDTSDPSQ